MPFMNFAYPHFNADVLEKSNAYRVAVERRISPRSRLRKGFVSVYSQVSAQQSYRSPAVFWNNSVRLRGTERVLLYNDTKDSCRNVVQVRIFGKSAKESKQPQTGQTPTPSAAAPEQEKTSQIRRTSTSFVAKAVKLAGPAVVRIDTERVVQLPSDPVLEDPLFRYFFGDDFQRQLPKERTERGQGSGFFISADGLLLTNAHVVSKASKVTVTLIDGRSYPGKVVGTDDLLDLAVIRIDTNQENVPVAPLGSSAELQVGDWVIALGNPVGLDNTVTLGIVSSLNRSSAEVGIPDKKINFIQTDAAINPGNSGGPLVNEFGEVVGISTAIRPNAEGIGFAIPIDTAKSVMEMLAKGEKVQHPFIGIQMVTLTPELAKQNNQDPNALTLIPEVSGVLVLKVLPKTPAADSGLRRFDVILSVNGSPTANARDIQKVVDGSRVGQELKVRVLRGVDGKTLDIVLRTADMTQFRLEEEKKQVPEDGLESPPGAFPMPRHRRFSIP
jgi:S1-C subfamily serine protease